MGVGVMRLFLVAAAANCAAFVCVGKGCCGGCFSLFLC